MSILSSLLCIQTNKSLTKEFEVLPYSIQPNVNDTEARIDALINIVKNSRAHWIKREFTKFSKNLKEIQLILSLLTKTHYTTENISVTMSIDKLICKMDECQSFLFVKLNLPVLPYYKLFIKHVNTFIKEMKQHQAPNRVLVEPLF